MNLQENIKRILREESRFDDAITKLLGKLGIRVVIEYWQDNRRDSITGSIYLYKKNEIFGRTHGYEFFYKYDSRFNSLKYKGHFPNIENLTVFAPLPSDKVVKFFSDKVENYLIKCINDGFTTLRRG